MKQLNSSLAALLVALVLAVVALSVLPARAQLPGRQNTPEPTSEEWVILGILEQHTHTGLLRLRPLVSETPVPPDTPAPPTATRTPTPSATVTPTPTPTATATATNTPGQGDATPTPEDDRTPTSTPVPSDTPTPPPTTEPGGCVVRSTANVWARTLPVIREDTGIAVLPADSPIHIDAYTIEQTADAAYIWYRYWFDVDHPEAWSRADLFTERDASAACELLPQETP